MPPKKTLASRKAEAAVEGVDKYVKLDPREHVLTRPNMYIGPIVEQCVNTWILDPESMKMVKREIRYVAGLYKIYDEVLVNAVDHVTRMKMEIEGGKTVRPVKSINIDIDRATGIISVCNDGDGIDVVKHPEYSCYVPELIFGNMLTSSNYDDTEDRVIGGQNGIGAKACNIFSKRFEVETVDGNRKLHYHQVFEDNMSTKSVPVIKKCSKAPYTKFTFLPDYERFGLPIGNLSDDLYGLMMKRAYEVAAMTDTDVKVFVNDKRITVKNFETYADLYLGSKSEHKRFYLHPNPRWEVVLSLCPSSCDSFEQVSFVNGIWTMRGGKHVDHVTNQVVKKITEVVQKKKKDAVIKPNSIKDNLIIFVKSTIVNPTFDNQSKEFLTTNMGDFGSRAELDEKVIAKLVTPEFLDRILSGLRSEDAKQLTKTDGKKQSNITGIPKLDDANWAGTKRSGECTLILTEGDSAKALAISGLSVVGRDKFGVFPLRGKILNVRDASAAAINGNAEIVQLKKILGLESGKVYRDVSELRYGKIMIMVDADVDGSHIKGLLFNIFATQWSSLLQRNGFLTCMTTPILKATHKRNKRDIHSFYNMKDFKVWSENHETRDFEIKYYKGLGTSTSQEAKEYFQNLKQIEYKYTGPDSDKSLELAFHKDKADDRKGWILGSSVDDTLDCDQVDVSYEEFIHKELIHFSVYNAERMIPSMVDGLKKSLRKILYCSFKRNLVKEIKVAQLAGYVSEHGAYHHGEQSLNAAIVGMAQDYVGSNNINLLKPIGQFGTRLAGGKDAASSRYIFTELESIAFRLFCKEDREILSYLSEDGQTIEPKYYMPVLPMILVNGDNGIATGFSTSIPAYNPKDIMGALRMLLSACRDAGDSLTAAGSVTLPEMAPWYRGYQGDILKDPKTGSYISRGSYRVIDDQTVEIGELPIGVWTDDYKEFIEDMIMNEKKGKIIKRYESHYTEDVVKFILHFHPDALGSLISTPVPASTTSGARNRFEMDFKLSSTKGLHTSNMYLFNEKGEIRLYKSPEEIIHAYFPVRWEGYRMRKEWLIGALETEILYLGAKVKFIRSVIAGELVVSNRAKADIQSDLSDREYPLKDGSYDYLVKMPIYTLCKERKEELEEDLATKEAELARIRATKIVDMWNDDLDAWAREYETFLTVKNDNRSMAAIDAAEKKPKKRAAKQAPKTKVSA
jgi:DNA topoisomerase-2